MKMNGVCYADFGCFLEVGTLQNLSRYYPGSAVMLLCVSIENHKYIFLRVLCGVPQRPIYF